MEEQKKLSYEELEVAANQLMQANTQMRKQLEQQNYGNFHQRMAYLFEVVRSADKFNASFVDACIKELEITLTIPEQSTEDTDK